MGDFSQNFYSILNVRPDSSMSEIKKQYRKLVLKYHPDLNKSPEAEEMFKKINKAFSILSNPKTRLKYDTMIEEENNSINIIDYIKKLNIRLKKNYIKRNQNFSKEEIISVDQYTLELPSSELYRRVKESTNPYVKKVAILALIKKDLNSNYHFLIKVLKEEENYEVIIFTLNFISEIYGKKIIYDIFFLKDSKSKEVKFLLIDLCLKYKCSKSEEIIKALIYDKDIDVRLKAIEAIKEYDSNSLLQIIYNLLNDENELIKLEAKNIFSELKKALI
ncbi:MAG: DnaJ domain-containing protein [Spirochaetes bacterium]|nr:DnaJ domain-containing protein [Spirochaetota bacterium]